MSPHLLAAGTVMAAHVERSHRPDPDGCVRGDQRPFSRWLGRLRRPQWRGACEMGGRNAEEVVDDWENAEGKTPQSHCVIFLGKLPSLTVWFFCSPWPHSSFFSSFFSLSRYFEMCDSWRRTGDSLFSIFKYFCITSMSCSVAAAGSLFFQGIKLMYF